MKWFFLVLFCLFLAFVGLSLKYNNPFKLIFVFGKKGSGKSCLMVRYMIKYLKKGWNVYTDISDIKIPGVRVIDSKNLEFFRPEENSLLCLDEVGLTYDNRKFKTFAQGVNEFYKFQRKYKCMVIMNSQSYDIDLKIRSLVDSMILQTNIGNFLSISRPIKRSITLTEPTSEAESRIADKLSFRGIFSWKFYYMPKYFKYFDSFAAPERALIPYTEVLSDLKDLRSKNVKKSLRRTVSCSCDVISDA